MKLHDASILVLACSLAFIGCRNLATPSPEYWIRQVEAPDPKEAKWPEEVSLIRLIANPQEFDGRFVRVFGYLHMEFERDAIFLRKEDCEQWLEINSLSIGVSRAEMKKDMQNLSDRYVLLEGKFHYRKGDSKGTIWRIQRVEPHFTSEEFIRGLKKETVGKSTEQQP